MGAWVQAETAWTATNLAPASATRLLAVLVAVAVLPSFRSLALQLLGSQQSCAAVAAAVPVVQPTAAPGWPVTYLFRGVEHEPVGIDR